MDDYAAALAAVDDTEQAENDYVAACFCEQIDEEGASFADLPPVGVVGNWAQAARCRFVAAPICHVPDPQEFQVVPDSQEVQVVPDSHEVQVVPDSQEVFEALYYRDPQAGRLSNEPYAGDASALLMHRECQQQ